MSWWVSTQNWKNRSNLTFFDYFSINLPPNIESEERRQKHGRLLERKEAQDRENHQGLHHQRKMRQVTNFPVHCAQVQHHTRKKTLNERRSPCQKGNTGSRAPLDPTKISDPFRLRWTPSETIEPPQEKQDMHKFSSDHFGDPSKNSGKRKQMKGYPSK